jgi:hypothetical protein
LRRAQWIILDDHLRTAERQKLLIVTLSKCHNGAHWR